MSETTIDTITVNESKPGCPQCGNAPRLCTKTGPAYRKKTKESPRVKVQMYLCKNCGYKGRGNMFHMTEEMGVDKEKAVNVIETKIPVGDVNDSN